MVLPVRSSEDAQSMSVLSLGIGKFTELVVHIAKAFVRTRHLWITSSMDGALDRQDVSKNIVGLSVLSLFGQDGSDTFENGCNIRVM